MVFITLYNGLFLFGRNLYGIIFRPYEAYRRITSEHSVADLIYIFALLVLYFAVASLVKTAAFRPYLLTRQFVVLSSTAFIGYCLVVGTGKLVGSAVHGKGTWWSLARGWAYTLVPTVSWFFLTSLLYLVLPPPRTTRIEGVLFSLVYVVISTTLLLWKITLGYLTFRFGFRLTLEKIILVTLAIGSIISLYSYTTYVLGIFKVPFL